MSGEGVPQTVPNCDSLFQRRCVVEQICGLSCAKKEVEFALAFTRKNCSE
jgi:hypothetical protein